MKAHRIWGITIRYLYLLRRNLDKVVETFYWPAVDLILWGLTSIYFASLSPDSNNVLVSIVSGILLWIIVYRGQFDMCINLLEELWNRNLINIFVSPLKFSEWLIGIGIMSIVKLFTSFAFAAFLAFVLYQIDVFDYGFYLLPFVLNLMLTGWWMAFFINGLILRYGTRVQSFGWSLIMVISPFSAIYYPVSTLPQWAQTIAQFIPTSYIFEGMRQVIFTGQADTNKIIYSFVLNFIFIIITLIYLKSSFNAVLNKGLVKVY